MSKRMAKINLITKLSGPPAWLGGGDPNISGKAVHAIILWLLTNVFPVFIFAVCCGLYKHLYRSALTKVVMADYSLPGHLQLSPKVRDLLHRLLGHPLTIGAARSCLRLPLLPQAARSPHT
jgi:hypothetical protein